MGEEEGDGRVETWVGRAEGKLNPPNLDSAWQMRGREERLLVDGRVAKTLHLPHTAGVALLLLLLSTRPQLLLSQDHLLLHVAQLLFGPPTVLLQEQRRQVEEHRKFCCVSGRSSKTFHCNVLRLGTYVRVTLRESSQQDI